MKLIIKFIEMFLFRSIKFFSITNFTTNKITSMLFNYFFRG